MSSSSGKPFVQVVSYAMFSKRLCKQSGRWEDVLDNDQTLPLLLCNTDSSQDVLDNDQTLPLLLCNTDSSQEIRGSLFRLILP